MRFLVEQNMFNFITVYNSSCGKIMFSQVSVCLQTPPWEDTAPGRPTPWADTPQVDNPLPRERRPLQRTVRILLECILVSRN